MELLALQRLRPGRRPPRRAPATTTAPGRRRSSSDAARPRRPTIRHCIGVRSWASSMSTWAKPSSSMRCVGGVQARPVGGVLALGRRGQLLQVDAALEQVVVELVVVLVARPARRRGRSAARRAAARPRPTSVSPPPTTSAAAAAPRRRRRPRRPGPGTRGRAASRAPSAASSGGHQATANSTNAVVDSISSSNASRPRSRPRSPRTWRHIASSSARRDPRQLPVAAALRHQLAADRARACRGRARSRRRARRSGSPSGAPGACWRAVRRISSAIRAEPLTSATAGSSWRVARTPSTTSPSDRSATAVSPSEGSTRSM